MAGVLRFAWRVTAFSGGFLLGVLSMVVVLIGLQVWTSHRALPIYGEIWGAEVSQHGGVSIAIKKEHGSITQTCNGVCDNFSFAEDTPDNVYRVEVHDAAGECVLCDPGDYVGDGTQVRWRIGGQDKLVVQKTMKSSY